MSRLGRWSARKRGQEAPADEAADPAPSPSAPESPPETHAASTEEEAEAEPATAPDDRPEEALPAPDSLPAGSDFTPYLAQGISPDLRRRALRRLFATGDYGLRDGLDDYDHDYRQHRPPSGEVVARLRHWLHELDDDTKAPEPAPPDTVADGEETSREADGDVDEGPTPPA